MRCFSYLMLVLLRCFSCTPDATSSECFSCTPDATSSEVFLLHTSFWFKWGVSLTQLMLVLVRCFSYTPYASLSEVFLLHTSC